MEDMDSSVKDDMMREIGARGMAWRIGASVFSVTLWLAFGIVWLFFYAGSYGFWQNVALFIVSLIVLAAVNASMWISVGMRARAHVRGEWTDRRSIASAVTGVAWLTGLAAFLYWYAGSLTLYQDLGVFLLSLVLLAGANIIIHARSVVWWHN
ncbi:MAG: hypothetical protein ABR879_05880 [Methanomassiliicoccales archaeon]|jgi:hypothetical protein